MAAESASATSAPTMKAITGAATVGGVQLKTIRPTTQSDFICSSAEKHATITGPATNCTPSTARHETRPRRSETFLMSSREILKPVRVSSTSSITAIPPVTIICPTPPSSLAEPLPSSAVIRSGSDSRAVRVTSDERRALPTAGARSCCCAAAAAHNWG